MTEFITEFEGETGTVKKFRLEYKGEMIFPKEFKEKVIKIIGESSCEYGNVTKIDMTATEITNIKDYAFGRCFNLQEIAFPSSLQEIGSNAFLNTNLTKISIGAKVSSMTGYAWNQISTIEIFSVDQENRHFSSDEGFLFNKDKTKLIRAPAKITSEKDIPNIEQITSIGEFAFTSTKLKSFKCTSMLNSLDEFAFHALYDIVEVDLSIGTFSVIPQNCFFWCDAAKISLPHTVKTIKTEAFSEVHNLKTLIIYKNAETIEENAFHACPKLKSIYYLGTSDHSNIACISSDVKADVYVTKDYSFGAFCKFDVSKEWSDKEKTLNIHNNLRRAATTTLLLYVILCTS